MLFEKQLYQLGFCDHFETDIHLTTSSSGSSSSSSISVSSRTPPILVGNCECATKWSSRSLKLECVLAGLCSMLVSLAG